MKSIKLLLVSFTFTFIALMNISPVNAKPVVSVQYLEVTHSLTTPTQNYNTASPISNVTSALSSYNNNSFSTGLIFSSPTTLSKKARSAIINTASDSNQFFNNAMVFSDKLNQFISFFSEPNKSRIIPQEDSAHKSNIIKDKCEKSLNFS